MQCSICKTGTTCAGEKNIRMERDGHMIIIKGVQGEVCTNCGELYMSAEITRATLAKANELLNSGAELQLVHA